MLVCSVSQLRRRAAIAADIAETTIALDAPGTGNVVFATLVDDPASVRDRIDAFLGQIMLEAANASSTLTAGLAYVVAVTEISSRQFHANRHGGWRARWFHDNLILRIASTPHSAMEILPQQVQRSGARAR